MSLTYKDAGVDTDQAQQLVQKVKRIAKNTHQKGVLGGIGGFGALFEIPTGYNNPVLVSGTDGVGTKLKLAIELNRHETIGIDLVAMCANDIITLGAKPLFFLDYFATAELDPEQAETVIQGIGEGCKQAGIALIGGETAEMPGMYAKNDYDLAGFCVGIVEKTEIIDNQRVAAGDVLIGLASSGPHSNGYSLIRKVLEQGNHKLNQPFEHSTLGKQLLTPTRLYVKSLLSLFHTVTVKAAAHITGGGLYENIPRVLPSYTRAVIDSTSWTWPSIFSWLQKEGDISNQSMLETFNVGAGMVLCVDANDAEQAISHLGQAGEKAWVIGHVEQTSLEAPEITMC
jgi:phosphoribosylformylglycinamidine cyclo-ligase